jgi:gentisate 1,2-dioxygenase
MVSGTRAGATHYEVQKKRRAAFLDEWRQHRKRIIKKEDVKLEDTVRGIRTGAYIGKEADSPTRTMDAQVHELDPGVVSTIHRHSWDAMLFIVEGSGWTEIDGTRYNWKPWDALHLPAWAWHRHGTDGETVARFMSYSSEPIVESFGMAMIEDAGHTSVSELPRRPAYSSGIEGDDPYARRVRRLAVDQDERRAARVHTAYDDVNLLPTPRGTRTAFLVDRSIGYGASGITQVMLQFAPGKGQSMHRHPGEAWLYVVEGQGHTYWGTEPTGGEIREWKAGDLIVVDHFLWHQHVNDQTTETARLVRIHMFDSVLETMRALMDPMVLFEEPPEMLAEAPDISNVEWPEDRRPP